MSRNIGDLHPELQEKVKKLKKLCEQQGINIGIGECFRSVAEQNALYAQGRTTPGKIVSNAKGSTYSSQHQWGVAFDFFKNEKGHEFDDSLFFINVSKLAKSIGLSWGGDWTSFKDRPHLYLPEWGSTTKLLKALYGTPEKFIATWGGAPTTAPTTPTNNKVTDGNDTKRAGQIHINNFTGAGIATDGIRGADTKKAGIMAVQTGLNKDYLADLKVDGIFGGRTETALSGNNVKKGENGYMITALEILLMLKGYNPGGVECPGVFGNNLNTAVRCYQKDMGLAVDGIAGIRTFKSLIA